MTVAELIEALKKMPQDAQVYSYTNLRQTFEKSQTPDVVYTEEDSYSFETVFSDEEDAVYYGVENPVKVVVL